MENVKTGCRIKSVKFKNGGHIEVLPDSNRNFSRVLLGDYGEEWGEVTFRTYDNQRLTVADLCYMVECAKARIRTG